MGLFSLLDAISSRPLDQVIEELGIDGDVKDALNGEPNALRPIYELVLAYEQGSWDEVTALASQVGIERSDVPGLYLPAVEWANSSLAMTT
jgi:c-di-GMP-related signal transduction protein